MNRLFLNLLSATHGNGPSCTRLVYLINGVASCFCALFATIGGTLVYCVKDHTANPVYWAGVAAMWTTTLGFGAMAKSNQQKATKEIVLAGSQRLVPNAAGSR